MIVTEIKQPLIGYDARKSQTIDNTMSSHLQFESPHSGYIDIIRHILKYGTDVPSRGGDTIEVENVTITFKNSSIAIPPKRRGFSPLLGMMEGAQLIGQFSRPKLMDTLWPKYSAYTDHYGDYGDRAAYGSQIGYVVNTLKNDPSSRRAVIALWNGAMDTEPGHQDYPCTLTFGFRIRDGKLNMTVTMRSNDIWRGTSSDVIQFSMLHQTVAKLVGVEPGHYTHMVHSLHMYKTDTTAVLEMLHSEQNETDQREYVITPLAKGGWDYPQTRQECKAALSASNTLETYTAMGTRIADLRFKRQAVIDKQRSEK